MSNKKAKIFFVILFLINLAACSQDQENITNNAETQLESRANSCGCVIQIPDINNPCCYRIKCDKDRYIVIGIDGCPNGAGYNFYNITGTAGTIGGWTTICSPFSGNVILSIHDNNGRCGRFSFCDLFPTVPNCASYLCKNGVECN